ncbi:MAG: helix-turn-helix domain-containing protein [Nanoarchaeota archaeon]|nr:helix-turn-helix domain-containing protein [Nanoarchaeota archaeon]
MYEQLAEAGLTKAEARIYAALVDAGKAQAGAISRKTGIHRRNVYDALERLVEKGLCSFIRENNKRYYMASEPRKLLEAMDARKEALLSILPELEAKFNAVKQKQETQFYKGTEGIRGYLMTSF